MKYTSEEIEEDVFKLVKASTIASKLTGKVYRQGTRPFDSTLEDLVVSFLTGLNDNFIQSSSLGLTSKGIITLNVWIPDIDNGDDVLVKNIARCKELGVYLVSSIASFSTTNYSFEIESTPQTFAEPDIHQHFVNVKLKYYTKN